MKTPTSDDLRFAAEWLRQYDDSHDGGKMTAQAELIAEWLDDQATSKDIRETARLYGVPTAALKGKLNKPDER